MKLVYIANVRIPTEKAHGLQIMENCSAFVKSAGLDVLLVIPCRLNKIKEDPFSYYTLEGVFKIKKLWCLDLLALSFLKRLWFALETISFTFSAWVYAIRHKKEIDVLYTREMSIAACLASIKPLFYEVHNLPIRLNWFYRRAFTRAKGIIVISEGLKNDLVKWGVAEEKILVARDGVNIEKFDIPVAKAEARAKLNLLPDKFIAIYTGHLYSWKGADLLAKVAESFAGSVDFYFIGGTEADVARFRGQYRSGNIHILGHKGQDEIPYWLKAADVLILPNSGQERISSHYTSPLKLFEYMASGTPMVVSDLPSMREVVNDQEVLFFVPGNPDDLRVKIKNIQDNYDEWKERALALVSKAAGYSWPRRAKLIIDAINSHD